MRVGILQRDVLEAPTKLASVDAGLQRVQVMSQPIDGPMSSDPHFRHAYAVVRCRKCAAAGVDRDSLLAALGCRAAAQLTAEHRDTSVQARSTATTSRTLGEQGATHCITYLMIVSLNYILNLRK